MTDLAGRADDLNAEAVALTDDIVGLRRQIHRRPELGLDNPETQSTILAALAPLGLEIQTGVGLTSIVADLKGSRPGPTLLLRADTDALPMTEDTDWDHKSEHADRAHVCGHDAHVAMLVGAARILADRRDEIAGTIRFIFQPGEEGSGGAAVMVKEGVLAKGLDRPVDAAFAMHITPNLPVGYVSCRGGPLMAATDDFEVTVRGKGGHASTPHLTIDPMPVACEMVTALQTLVTRRINALDPAVVTVAHITGGSTKNVIPETVQFEGTIRSLSEPTRDAICLGFARVLEGVAAAHDCNVEIQLERGYPVTVNDAEFVTFVERVVGDTLGEKMYFPLPWPVMGAEDFSYILEEVPGAMALLGVCPEDITNSLEAPSCHSNYMRLNEAGLAKGAALHAAVALSYCAD
jgi:amidohydrolase